MYTLDILNRLNDINADKDIKSLSHAVFPGTHCPLFGVILTASYIKNMALVVVGTSECTYYAKNFAYHRQEGLDSVYSVAIKESDVVFSAEKKVKQAIKQIIEFENPDAIMVVSTCVPEVIGEDYSSLSYSLEDEVDIPVFVVNTDHFTCNAHIPGMSRSLAVLSTAMKKFKDKKGINILGHRQKNVEETELTRKFASRPFVPSVMAERNLRCEEILTIQAMGLKKRLAHAHAKSAVVGISGGLDSTLALLVSAKAFDALGMDRSGITAVTMPCFGTTDRTYQNACKMSLKLGATLREIPVGAAVEQHFKDIGHDPEDHSVTYENSQARERTQVLMDVANQTGGIVIGTGDMSELALGWATYNGDHMSMYGVNASVPKTLVRHLVHYYADTCKDQELKDVLYDVLDTPVSPELLPPKDGEIAQKTEDLVGPYELHDFFLYYLLRFSYEPGKIYRIARYAFDGEYDDATIYKWLYTFCRRFFIQQFKRSCLPDGPKVGTVALSPRGDWRMPSDACAEVWLRDLEKAKPVGM